MMTVLTVIAVIIVVIVLFAIKVTANTYFWSIFHRKHDGLTREQRRAAKQFRRKQGM